MDFVSFLQQSRNADFWERNSRICLTGKDYPAFFLSDFFTQIKDVIAPHYTGLQVMDTSSAMGECMASLETTFLGMRSLYWLKNVSDASTSSKQQWLSYVSSYQGPHSILFFVDTADAASMDDDAIVVPHAIDKQLFTQLFTFFAGAISCQRAHSAIQALYTRHTTVSLEMACVMIAGFTSYG